MGEVCLIGGRQHPSDEPLPSSLPLPPSQIKCSDGDDENTVVDAGNKIFNAAVGTPEEASSDIACFLYGRCHRKAISATVKLPLWLQRAPLWPPLQRCNTQYPLTTVNRLLTLK